MRIVILNQRRPAAGEEKKSELFERTTAEHEGELCGSEEENRPERRLLDVVVDSHHGTGVQLLAKDVPSEKHAWTLSQNEEDPGALCIIKSEAAHILDQEDTGVHQIKKEELARSCSMNQEDTGVHQIKKEEEAQPCSMNQEDLGVNHIKKEEEPRTSSLDREDPGTHHIKKEEAETSDHEEIERVQILDGKEPEGMEDYISKLQQFSKLDLQSKKEIILKGRPTPELKGLLQTAGQKTRSFQTEWYTRKGWLCGCPARNRLFCFSCLLFSTSDNVWTQTGYCDLKNLPRSLIKHEQSTTHIQNQIALKTFGMSRIDLALDEQRRLNNTVHNVKVKENRQILKDLINATCFLAKQQLPFHGNANRGNYVELLHAFAEKDDRLAGHLETSPVFSDLSTRIQNDLIEAIGDVIRNDIKKEIRATPFVAVEVDETTDATNQAQVSVILRYVAKSETDWEVKEAFLGFDDVGGDRRAPAVADYVLGVLKEYDCVEKLVAQTYDGAAVTASELSGVQSQIKDKVPEAMFTHCYAHNLNLVLLHSTKCLPECWTFFKTAQGLASFFSKSPKRTHVLDDVIKRRLAGAAPTRWNWNSGLLETISMHHNDLRALFHIVLGDRDSWDNETLMMAAGYDEWLSKASTCFLLMTYGDIFSEIKTLFRVLQNKAMDIECCLARIRDTVEGLERMRLEFNCFYDRFEKKCSELGLTESGGARSIRYERKQAFGNILDNVSCQMTARFDGFSELAFLGLVDCAKFGKMSQHFDDKKLQSLSKYAKFFDFVKLKADLIGLYSSQTVREECKSPAQLLSFLAEKDLIQTVPEATKLLQLVLTVPANAASVERPFSALERLKTYSRNATDREGLSSLAVIYVETERLLKLKEAKEDFYKQVITAFVQKERRMDFIYK